MTTGPRIEALASLAVFALLAVTTIACGSERSFRAPETLHTHSPKTPFRALRPYPEPTRDETPDLLPFATRPITPPTEIRLSNGMRIVLLERHEFPVVSGVFVVDRGAASAPAGVVAVFAEAMLGLGDNPDENDAWQYLYFLGAHVSHSTSHESTRLELSAMSPLFVSAMSRIAPMFTSPSFSGRSLDLALDATSAHRAERRDLPENAASDVLLETLYAAPHPWGIPIEGEHSHKKRVGRTVEGRTYVDVDNLPSNVSAFAEANLTADRVSLAIVGDFDTRTMTTVLERDLAKLPRKPGAPAPVMPTLAPATRRVVIVDRPGSSQSAMTLGWRGPRASDEDVLALELLANAAGSGLGSTLNRSVRKELGASYGVRMVSAPQRSAGLVTVTASVGTEQTAKALETTLAGLQAFRAQPMSAEDLAVARIGALYDLEQSTHSSLARLFANALADGRPASDVVTHNARAAAVTSEQVQAAAVKYLHESSMQVVIVGDAARIEPGIRALGFGDVEVRR